MKKFIALFSNNHILTNLFVVLLFIFAIYAWNKTPKEEMPEATADYIFVFASYPGASPSEVEYYVTREIEDAIKGVEGIKDITSSSSTGSCSINIELDPRARKTQEVFDEIEDIVLKIKYPEEMTNDPRVRQIKSTNKPIIDIALYNKDKHILTPSDRQQLQDVVYALENRLLALPTVSEVSDNGYLSEVVAITVDPKKLALYDLSYSSIVNTLKNQNVRQPIGQLSGEDNARITLYAELNDVDKILNAVIRSSFSGPLLRIKDVATVVSEFATKNSIIKVNGHEAVIITAKKTASSSIIDSSKEMNLEIERFFSSMKNSQIEYVVYGDESVAVKNRISLITSNGAMGFFIIVVILFLLLNFKSGLWVGMGIPFSIAVGMIGIYSIGYTINNMTLAGVIIVLGMLVDDAIVIAENITRREEKGEAVSLAVVNGTATMVRPVLASILTTCVAFVPLYFFSGMMGKIISVIPAVIFFMLGGSFIEAISVLPSHLNFSLPFSFAKKKNKTDISREHWFMKIEAVYAKCLSFLLKIRWAVLVLFIILLVGSAFIYIKFMRFEQFPREEAKSIYVIGECPTSFKMIDTEKAVRQIEQQFSDIEPGNIEIFLTRIAGGRRGNQSYENRFTIEIKLFPKEKRSLSLLEIESQLQKKIEPLKSQFISLNLSKQRFSPNANASGSPLEIQVLENDDTKREAIAQKIKELFDSDISTQNGEIEVEIKKPQYDIGIKRDLIQRLGISASDVGSVLRTVIAGSTIFYHYRNDVEIPVNITVKEEARKTLVDVLELPVSSRSGYLVPISTVVDVNKTVASETIRRLNGKRLLTVYGELKPNSKDSPLNIASRFEKEFFPQILADYPTAVLQWGGEVKSTRESQKDFQFALAMVLFLIYFILCVLFQSLLKPFLIMISIPFGVIGVILALCAHGITTIGLFTLIGVLGLCGVVVNDSIVMIAMLQEHVDDKRYGTTLISRVAKIAATRLRAVVLTTVTTVAGLMPTAYGILGYDSMLSDMMLAMSWGLIFATFVTLVLIPILFYTGKKIEDFLATFFSRFGIELKLSEKIHDDIEIGTAVSSSKEEDPYGED